MPEKRALRKKIHSICSALHSLESETLPARSGFVILYPRQFFEALEHLPSLSPNTVAVFRFLLDNMSPATNIASTDPEEMEEACKISLSSIYRILNSLKKANIIRVKPGRYMINPNMINASRSKKAGENRLKNAWQAFGMKKQS
ncbi:MAG: replication/maintenance protein RepL [Desulfovibrionaceae bacterium]|nr:replication/maintenance protein RepL [Desulfovibrionaceae bacterium]